MILKSMTLLLALAGFLVGHNAQAAWSKEKTEQATEYLRQYRKDWSINDTLAFLSGGANNSVNIGGDSKEGGTTYLTIKADDGRLISLMATGQSLLVDGKDVTGNLGSKTTYGTNSPIIEDVKDSQIAAGSQNTVSRDTTTNYSLTISLSLALSVSVALNLHLLRRSKTQARDQSAVTKERDNTAHPPSA